MFKRFIVPGLLFGLMCGSSRATMIVIVTTPDGYWIGADSARSRGGKRFATVCKVHETKFGFLLKGGNSQGTTYDGRNYSTDKEVENILVASGSAADFKTDLESAFISDIETELIYAMGNPYVTAQNFRTNKLDTPIPSPLIPALTRDIALLDGEYRRGEFLIIKPRYEPTFDLGLGRVYHYWAGSEIKGKGWIPFELIKPWAVAAETGTKVSFPESVRFLDNPVNYDRPDAWVQSHPKEALLEMLKKGHEEQPEEIGEPLRPGSRKLA